MLWVRNTISQQILCNHHKSLKCCIADAKAHLVKRSANVISLDSTDCSLNGNSCSQKVTQLKLSADLSRWFLPSELYPMFLIRTQKSVNIPNSNSDPLLIRSACNYIYWSVTSWFVYLPANKLVISRKSYQLLLKIYQNCSKSFSTTSFLVAVF